MPLFVAVCAKNGQRVELAVRHSTIELAREDLHRQGYSIVEISETTEESTVSSENSVFFFEIELHGQKKTGQIQSSDIFKAYIKLRDDLKYNVVFLYDDKDATLEYKTLSTTKLQENYAVYKGLEGKKNKNEEEKNKKPAQDIFGGDIGVFNKDLAKYGNLIDRVISKIDELIMQYRVHITEDRTARLRSVQTSLKQVRNITNVDKLRIIGESALEKIGELEIELLEKDTTLQKGEFLSETNALLKQFGSNKRVVIEKDQMQEKIKSIISSFLENFKKEEEAEKSTPKASGLIYYNNLREIGIYKQKLRELQREIFKSIITFSFFGEKKERLELKKKLIKQNINLLKARIGNKKVPYLRIIQGISYYSDVFLYICRSFGTLLLYSVFLYSLSFFLFSGYSIFSGKSLVSHEYIYAITVICIMSFFLRQVQSWISCILSVSAIIGGIFLLGINF